MAVHMCKVAYSILNTTMGLWNEQAAKVLLLLNGLKKSLLCTIGYIITSRVQLFRILCRLKKGLLHIINVCRRAIVTIPTWEIKNLIIKVPPDLLKKASDKSVLECSQLVLEGTKKWQSVLH